MGRWPGAREVANCAERAASRELCFRRYLAEAERVQTARLDVLQRRVMIGPAGGGKGRQSTCHCCRHRRGLEQTYDATLLSAVYRQ
jgi:hypothetical protein